MQKESVGGREWHGVFIPALLIVCMATNCLLSWYPICVMEGVNIHSFSIPTPVLHLSHCTLHLPV